MTLIKFTKNITCEDGLICSEKCMNDFSNLFIHNNDGHVSISHQNGNHQFWIFFYDNDGIHEFESNGKIIKQNNVEIKKYKNKIPDKSELINILSN